MINIDINNKKRNFVWNTLGTSLFSFNSLFLMIIVTRLNGLDAAGIFSFAFASSSIINIIALYYGRTYQVTDKNTILDDSTYVMMRFMSSFLAFMLSIGFVVLNQYGSEKASIFILLALLKCIEAISDVYYGILQKQEKLYIAGKSLSFKSISSLITFLLINYFSRNLVLSCFMMIVVNLIFLKFYDIKYAKREVTIKYKLDWRKLGKLTKYSSYTFMFTLIVLIVLNIPRYAIDYLLDEKSQAIYGIVSMPATFIMLFGQFILQPSLVSLATYYHNNEIKLFKKVVFKIILILFIFLVPLLPIAYFWGMPVLQLIYNVDLLEYNLLLVLVLFGAICYAASNVLLNALVTLRCTKQQLVLQLFMFCFSIFLSFILVTRFGIQGSVFSYSIILLLQFILYILLYLAIIKKKFNQEDKNE